jgi:hypothetical protein
MSAAADDILNAVKAVVETAFAGKKCHLRRASEKNPELAADMDVAKGCFAASCNDDRPTEMLWAGVKGVKYTVTLAYLTKEMPGDRAASAAIEQAVDQMAKLFQVGRNENGKPGLRGVPAVSTCNVKPLAPYKLPFDSQTVNASGVQLVFETVEDA